MDIEKRERDLLIYLLWEVCFYTNSEIGEQFGISYSEVSRSIKVTQGRMEKDPGFKNNFGILYSQIKI